MFGLLSFILQKIKNPVEIKYHLKKSLFRTVTKLQKVSKDYKGPDQHTCGPKTTAVVEDGTCSSKITVN